MFNFRIINLSDGNQVIRRDLKTPYSALTPIQMVEYVEMDVHVIMDKQKRKAQMESKRRQKMLRNPLYRLAYLCGLV